jgi:hypothetical protein
MNRRNRWLSIPWAAAPQNGRIPKPLKSPHYSRPLRCQPKPHLKSLSLAYKASVQLPSLPMTSFSPANSAFNYSSALSSQISAFSAKNVNFHSSDIAFHP